ncbi:DHA2 family efflux MFS transporter permease subunit [Janibacter cremeus]|uniref:EmrB/QacA subfamily drug resistance transporter n=1 Tax=Janibacter cremeus TaxID=1285192 RepID=A0A852VXA2_9MICO|nr:DHA2 family efflux MFS transporter permease subunit [Janibacter cremeus]NYF98161.1 EmrB/QacA subfamily drug resistance transporter [Janibacter cremeus]
MTVTQGNDFPDNPWPALWALVIGFFMILVDVSIVSIATPALMESFDAGIEPVLWVTSAYLLAYAVPLLITGRFGDRYGPKRIYLVGLTIFTLASLACGFSPTIHWLVAARVVQGLGASLMTPQTMAVITRTFPPQRRGSAMALWGATAGVAFLVGPLLGGLLLDAFGWEWIFFINVPVGLIGMVMAVRLVPSLRTHAHAMDWVGVVLSAVGLFLVIFGLQEGEGHDWGRIVGPVTVPMLIAAGLLVLVAFIAWQARGPKEPLVPLGLFRDRNFSLANVAITMMSLAVTAMMFPLLVWLQTVRGFSPTGAAFIIAPQGIAAVLLARWVGHLVDRIHPRVLPTIGLGGFAVTLFVLAALMTPHSPLWAVLVTVTFIGITGAFVWGPLATTANRNLPLHQAGAGSGVYNATRQVGAVIGSAAIAAMMSARIAAHMGTGAAQQFAGGAEGMVAKGAAELPPQVAESLSAAFAESMLLPAGVLVVGALSAIGLEQMRHSRPGRRG